MQTLTTAEKREYKKRAHSLKPVVIIGQHGLSDPVLLEIDNALSHHELIKVRVNAENREQKQQIISRICTYQEAALVQIVGNIATLYRKKVDG